MLSLFLAGQTLLQFKKNLFLEDISVVNNVPLYLEQKLN